jgi:hypothetical protein
VGFECLHFGRNQSANAIEYLPRDPRHARRIRVRGGGLPERPAFCGIGDFVANIAVWRMASFPSGGGSEAP